VCGAALVASPALPAGTASAASAASVAASASAALSAAPYAAGAERGLDVSAFQHTNVKVINWRLLFRSGIRFVSIKVTEGTYYANPYYASDARAARAAGLRVLPYAFANPRDSGGAAQAAFAVAASGYRRGTMPPLSVDLENNPYTATDHAGNCYGMRAAPMVAWIAAFVRQAEALTGMPPVIYTTANWWRQCTGNTARFRRDPLWVAAYGVSAPAMPSSWHQWAFWQYTDSANVPGVGPTDLDYFRVTPLMTSLGRPGHSRRPGHARRRPAKKRARSARRKAAHSKIAKTGHPKTGHSTAAHPKVVRRKSVRPKASPISRKRPGAREPRIVRTSAPVRLNRTSETNSHHNHHVSPHSRHKR
jgi:GH25 family lysozyme M1 (1,4-beta-N-acetylmuramidase)